MKKFLLIAIFLNISLPAFSFLPTDASIIQVHDMQMINQQRFRMEEINDYKEVKEEKERFQKRIDASKPVIKNNVYEKKNFVEEDGTIKIKVD